MDIREALEIVHKHIPDRMVHIYGTVDKATHLAEVYGVNLYKCQIAAAFHDYAKYMPIPEMEAILKQYGDTSYLNYSTNVYHGPVARYLVETEFNITDVDILEAIEFHVTGRPNMGDVAKVVFISDYIERGRTHPTADFCRYLSEQSLDVAVLGISECTINYLKHKNSDIHPLTIQTYESFLEKVGVATYESIKNRYQRH